MKLWLKRKLTYGDLDPGNSWNPMMCRCNSQITSDCWPTITHPSHPLPPTTLRGSSSFSYLIPYHCPVCRLALGHTGVFHKTSFDINYWHNLCLSTLSSAFPFGMTFHTFTQHFFAEKCTLPLSDNNFDKSLFCSFLLHLPFNKHLPITYSEGIKRPCNPSRTELLTFMREREMGEWLVTTVYNSPYQTIPPLTFKFAIVRSCRGSKRKIIRMILTGR